MWDHVIVFWCRLLKLVRLLHSAGMPTTLNSLQDHWNFDFFVLFPKQGAFTGPGSLMQSYLVGSHTLCDEQQWTSCDFSGRVRSRILGLPGPNTLLLHLGSACWLLILLLRPHFSLGSLLSNLPTLSPIDFNWEMKILYETLSMWLLKGP